jgi:integrase
MSQRLEPILDKNHQRVANLFRDTKSDIIYAIVSIKNKKYKFSTKVKFPGVAKAKRVANLKLSEILGTNKKSITPLVKDEIPKYILLKESEGLDPKTIAVIRRMMVRIEKYWGHMQTTEITRDKLPEWFAWLDQKYPNQQRFNDVKYLRNFCRHLTQTQWNGQPMLSAFPKIIDPNHKNVIAKRKAKRGRIFDAAEFKKVYKAAPSGREKLVALIMYTMATRIEETLGLRFDHEVVKVDGQWAYQWSFGQNKADLAGLHFFHPKVCPFLDKLYGERRMEGIVRLFPQQRDRTRALPSQLIDFGAWRTKSNIGWHWTSHTFRHTCLSNLFNNEKLPQALICKLYRCSLALALDIYIKPTKSGREKMRVALKVAL